MGEKIYLFDGVRFGFLTLLHPVDPLQQKEIGGKLAIEVLTILQRSRFVTYCTLQIPGKGSDVVVFVVAVVIIAHVGIVILL